METQRPRMLIYCRGKRRNHYNNNHELSTSFPHGPSIRVWNILPMLVRLTLCCSISKPCRRKTWGNLIIKQDTEDANSWHQGIKTPRI